jgi:drug/metabolite transporter (DMT)-like permease
MNTSTPDGLTPDTPSSSDSTVVASPSSWKELPKLVNDTAQPDVKPSYLDVPSFRPSLDSTYSELTELSFQSNELHSQHPLVRRISNNGAAASQNHWPATSRFRAAWDSFIETNYGAILVLASQGFGTGMNISTRLLETPGPHGEPMHPFQILFVRQSITAVICTAYGMSTNKIPDFPWGQRGIRWLLILRGVAGFLGVFGLYFSLLYLPLSEATVLGFLTPILTCYLCSFIIPGETFTGQQQLAGFVSLFGVLFIARPTSLFSMSTSSTQPSDATMSPPSNSTVAANDPQHITSEQHLAAVGLAMLGVVGGTGALTSIRVIGERVHAFISINYFSWWCSIVSLLCLVIFKDVKFRLPGNGTEWGLLAMLGGCGFIMQFLLTAGLAYGGPGDDQNEKQPGNQIRDLESTGPPHLHHGSRSRPKSKASGTRATAMCYTQMLFALTADKFIFGISPDTMSWIGSVLILAGAVWVAAARDTATKDKNGQAGNGSARHHSAFGMLRRKGTSGPEATHEEAVGLMNDRDDGNDIYDEHDDDVAAGRRDGHHSKGLESVEMHELRPTTSSVS